MIENMAIAVLLFTLAVTYAAANIALAFFILKAVKR